MPPAVVAIGAAVATAVVSITVESAIVAALLTLAINVAAYVLTRKPQGKTNQGQELKLKLDPTMPRQIAAGRTATGGSVVWAFTYGHSSGVPGGLYLTRIIALSDIPCNALVKIMEGKEQLTFTGDVTTGLRPCSSHHKTDGGQSRLNVRVYLGSPTPTADADLISWSGGAWTSAHKGTNMCYAITRCEYDPDGNAFPSGEPQLTFVLDGARCYDDRKDGSKPGRTGTHRLNNPATWEFTRNTAILTAQLLRGFYSNSVLIVGAEAEERDLDDAMLLSAYNTCDEDVTVDAGTQNRYEAGMMLSSGEPVAQPLQEFQAAMDGKIIDRGGAITILPGAIRTPVFDLTDDDIIWAAEKSWQPQASLSELYNHVAGVFVDEETIFNEKGYPPLRNATWEADDGNERFTLNVSFAALTDWARVQRVTKRIHLASRYQGNVAFYLPLWALEMEQGDWFTLSSVRWNFTSLYFECLSVDITADMRIAVIAHQVAPAIDGWNHVVDEVARSDTTWSPPAWEMPSLAGLMNATGIKNIAGTGTETFGANVNIAGLGSTNVLTHIQVQISPQVGHTPITDLGNISPVDQDAQFFGLLPDTDYGVRVRGMDGQNAGPWTSWDDFTTPTPTFGATASMVGAATIYADYLGVIKSGQLPKIFSPSVLQGTTNIKFNNSTTYSVAFTNATGSVDNTNGSSTKGDVTLTGFTSSLGEIRLTIYVDGEALPVLKVALTRQNDAAPPSGVKLATFDTFNAVVSASYTQLVTAIKTVVVASGESLYGTGTLSYFADYTGTPGAGRWMIVQWQRSPTGAGTWTDFATGSPDTGSAASKGATVGPDGEGYYETLDPEPGDVICTQSSATPGAGTYDVRAVAKINSTIGGAGLNIFAGTLQVEAKV